MAEEKKTTSRRGRKPAAPKSEAPKVEQAQAPEVVEDKKVESSKAEKKSDNLVGKRILLFTGREFLIKEQKSDNVFVVTRPNKQKEYIFNRQDFEVLD